MIAAYRPRGSALWSCLNYILSIAVHKAAGTAAAASLSRVVRGIVLAGIAGNSKAKGGLVPASSGSNTEDKGALHV